MTNNVKNTGIHGYPRKITNLVGLVIYLALPI